MYLSSASQTITAVLSGSASPAPTYLTAYSSGFNRASGNGTLSNTAETIVPAPSGEPLVVDLISIYNADNASITLTLNLVDGANTRKLWVGTLAEGETLQYVNGKGFHAIDNTGRIKSSDTIALTLADAENLALGTSTGSKIGTSTSQKLGFFNATPVVQQSTTGTTTGFTAGIGTAAKDDSTFTGNTGSTAYTVGDVVKALKALGLLAA